MYFLNRNAGSEGVAGEGGGQSNFGKINNVMGEYFFPMRKDNGKETNSRSYRVLFLLLL